MKPCTAKRLPKIAPAAPKEDMATVVCDECGQRFAIHNGGFHNGGVHDAQLAEKQVAWLQDRLVWDHIQERKHHGNVELPNLSSHHAS